MDAAWSTLRSGARPRVDASLRGVQGAAHLLARERRALADRTALWEGTAGSGVGKSQWWLASVRPVRDATRRVPSHWAGSRVSRT